MTIIFVEAFSKEIVGARDTTVMTGGSGVGIGELPSSGRNDLTKGLPTGQARQWVSSTNSAAEHSIV